MTDQPEHSATDAAAAFVDSLVAAWNAHDLDAYVAHFADNYESRWPAHPDRDFIGIENVRERWARNFARMPDFHVEVLGIALDRAGDIWIEMIWSGTLPDGSSSHDRGVTINKVEDGRVVAARLYLEPREEG